MAEEAGAIVIAIVTTPFEIERDRHEKAAMGVEELTHYAHSLIVLDNNRLIEMVGNKPINQAFMVIDQFLAVTIKGITEVITEPSLINLDFNDVKSPGGDTATGAGVPASYADARIRRELSIAAC